MADSIVDRLARELKPNFSIVHVMENEYGIRDLRNPSILLHSEDGRRILFRNETISRSRYYSNLIALLRRQGAIKERTRTFVPKPPKQINVNAPKNAVIIAEETLKDSKASPRERALARNYLELFKSHQSVRKLAQHLGQKLKEIEKQID